MYILGRKNAGRVQLSQHRSISAYLHPFTPSFWHAVKVCNESVKAGRNSTRYGKDSARIRIPFNRLHISSVTDLPVPCLETAKSSTPQNSLNRLTLTRAVGSIRHPHIFLKWPPNRQADCAEILHSLWGVLCATFGRKKIDRVGSGHRAMTS